MSERRLLTIVAILLAANLIVAAVPAPFAYCNVERCVTTWWPFGWDVFAWLSPGPLNN